MLLVLPQSGPSLPLHDFVEYWAAGQLLAAGENPYDSARIHELELQAGRTEDAILMWNPPWVLPFVLPLGWLPVHTAHLLWLGVQLAALLLSADLLWRHYDGDPERRWLGPLVVLTFVPSLSAMIVGQISPLLLLGAAAFLPLVRVRRDVLAGAATTLLAIKPHMTYLFWVALVIWAIGAKRWRLLFSGAITGLLLTGLAMVFRPSVLVDYWHTFQQTPAQYASPTLGYLLRLGLDSSWFGWQFVPMVPGLIWLAGYAVRHRLDWDWSQQMPMLLLVSCLTAAYGAWLFDLVILLVAIVDLMARVGQAGRTRQTAALAWHSAIALGALVLMLIPMEVQYLYYLWITPVVLVGYVCLRQGQPTVPADTQTTPTPPLLVTDTPVPACTHSPPCLALSLPVGSDHRADAPVASRPLA
jgi:hypothetical protein